MIASPVLTEPGTINQCPPFLRAENVVIFSPVCSGPAALDESFVRALNFDLIEWLMFGRVRASSTNWWMSSCHGINLCFRLVNLRARDDRREQHRPFQAAT